MRVISLALICLVLSLPTIAQDNTPTTPNNRFGIVEGFWLPELTCELGVGWERIIFDWAQHQPNSADEWHTLNVDDRWLKNASQCGREVVALLKNSPAWATDGTPGVGIPRGLDLPIDDPNNVWANFVRRTVDYYASRGVNHFIIWNEPDISSDTYGYEFEGELDDYFQLLKVAYLVAKETNLSAIIHLAGTTYWHDVNAGRTPYMTRLVERIIEDPDAETNNYYFDVLSLHIYFRTDTVYEIVGIMREMLDEHGLTDKAIWINETNAAPTDDPTWQVERPVYQLDLTQQADFLIQASALALVADVERMAVYKLVDQGLPAGGESFGITSPADQSPRPAFYAWQTVVSQFADVTSAQLAQTDTVAVVWLTHTNGRQTLVAWARTEQSTQLDISTRDEKGYRFDALGNQTLLYPTDNTVQWTLEGANCNETDGCPVGGNTLILSLLDNNLSVLEIINGESVSLEFE